MSGLMTGDILQRGNSTLVPVFALSSPSAVLSNMSANYRPERL
jgi:hypothetical protein